MSNYPFSSSSKTPFITKGALSQKQQSPFGQQAVDENGKPIQRKRKKKQTMSQPARKSELTNVINNIQNYI